MSPYLQNNGPRFSASCVNAPTCTSAMKMAASCSWKLSSGSLAQARSGGCSRPSTASGTASTNASPDGVNGVSGNVCTNISSKNLTQNTSSSTVRSFGRASALRERPKRGGAILAGARQKQGRVQHQGACERGWTWQSAEIHADRRTKARHHAGR